MKTPFTLPRRCRAALALLAAFAGPAPAETLFTSVTDERTRWGLGFGVLKENEGYRGVGRKTEGVPLLYVETGRFRLLGPQAEFLVLGDKGSGLKLRADYRFDGFEAADGAVFAGMRERKGSLFLGLSGRHLARWGELTFDVVRATSASRGVRGGVTYAWPLQRGAWTVSPKLGVEFFDRKFVGYYYGVAADEATAGRAAYAGRRSVNLDVGVDLQWRPADPHTLLASVKYRRFGSAIEDSPLIAKSGSPRLSLGYLYRF